MSQSVAFAGTASNSGVSQCDCLAHRFGNAADHAGRERRYPSDLTDAQWAVVRNALPLPRWREGRGGRPESYCHRTMTDAVLYLVDNGIKWRAMPADFPHWQAVYRFFRRFLAQGRLTELHDRLRRRVRTREGRDPEPSAGIIDSQSVKADAVVGADTRGYDGAKKINGRKRHLAVDCLGVVTAIDANSSITKIDVAIKAVTDQRSNLGAFSNRLEYAIRSNDYAAENLTASDSRTRDTDMAGEMVNFTKNDILTQASQAMLAQANQLPQGVLQLLR